MTTSKPIHKSKIARRLVVYVLAFSTVVTLFLTVMALYRDYRYDISLIDEKFSEIQLTNQRVIEENLWILNSTSNELLLDGILHNQNIVYLSIVDDTDEQIVSKGQLPNSGFRQKEIRLTYHFLGKDHYIGRLKIVATLDYVYSRIFETVFIILITQGIKTFVISIFILFLVWVLITKHLVSIKDYALNIQIENDQEDLTLDRKDNYWTKGDEFHQLIDAINMMRKKLFNSYIEIEHQSLHDSLTGLPNRRLMDDRLKHELAQSERQHAFGAVLFIDLDHFKLLNDSLGHLVGDQVLIETSNRLKSLIRKGDTVARIGGDEFVIILRTLSINASDASHEAQIIGHKLQGSVNKKMIINDHDYSITASIGITLFDGSNDSCEEVLKHADNAMYEAKAEGRNKLRVFQSIMQQGVDERLLIEQKLHDAIAQGEFSLNYQPKYNRDREICSAEVLLRWQQSDGQFIPPNIFIPIAEETGQIVEIGYQVISMVFQQVAEDLCIRKSGLISIAINISPRQFREVGFAEFVISEVDKYGLNANLFILELTEEAVVSQVEKTIDTMNVLKRKGFKLSIDDFGTGYSSLRYLKDFPLDELKIDKSFVDHIVDNADDYAIVRSIISMANNLKLDVVAEGVEYEEQFELLLKSGCQKFQGYLLSKPVDIATFSNLLSENHLSMKSSIAN